MASKPLSPLEEIRIGDKVLVLPGERFPVDAKIAEGRTSVDESMLTGEATPLAARSWGARIGWLSQLRRRRCLQGRIAGRGHGALANHAHGGAGSVSRAPMERLADRASAIFVPVVLGLAVITFVVWMLTTHSVSDGIGQHCFSAGDRVPLRHGSCRSCGAHRGRGSGCAAWRALQGRRSVGAARQSRRRRPRQNRHPYRRTPRPSAVRPVKGYSEDDLLRMAAAAEERSNHPLAHAVVDYARSRPIKWEPAEEVVVIPGRGVAARVEGLRTVCWETKHCSRNRRFAFPESIPAREARQSTRLWMALGLSSRSAVSMRRDALRPDAGSAASPHCSRAVFA